MQELFATRLEIEANGAGDPLESVLADVAAWAWRGESDPPDLVSESSGRVKAPDSELTWRRFEAEGYPESVTRVQLRHEDSAHDGIEWLSAVDVVRSPAAVRVSIRISRGATEMKIAPAAVDLHRPRIVPALIQHHTACTSGDGIPLSTMARVLQPGDVDSFARDILTSSERQLPVVVLWAPAADARFGSIPDVLAGELAGLAHVYALSGHLAWERLRDAVGARRAVPRAGARLYWPGFGGPADRVRHPHWTRNALRRRPGRLPFPRFVFSMLAPLSVLRVPLDPAVWEVRAVEATKRRQELERRSKDEAIESVIEDLERLEELEEEVADLRSELAEKNELLLQHEANWTAVGSGRALDIASDGVVDEEADAGPATDEVAPVTDWKEVVELCEILQDSGAFVLTENAARSLADGVYPDPQRMLDHLERLADAAEAYRKAGGELGGRFEDWVRPRFNIEVALHDEGLVRSGRDKFEFEGRTHWGREPHVKVDDYVDPASCGRIYFALDSDGGRIIVDYVGLHL
jgi:hypothetical protein